MIEENKVEIIVPDLFFYEFANAIKDKYTEKNKLEIIKDIYSSWKLKFKEIKHSEKLLRNSLITASKDEKISIYDAIFFEIAKSENCKLITANDEFCKRINDSRVMFIRDDNCKEYIESLDEE